MSRRKAVCPQCGDIPDVIGPDQADQRDDGAQ